MLPEHSLLRLLTAIVFVQEYILERMIGALLRQRFDGNDRPRASAVQGSSAEMIKGAIAAEMARECDKALLDEEYQKLLRSHPVIAVGLGAARVRNATPTDVTPHAKVIALIDAFLIPDVRARLRWRTRRGGWRHFVNRSVNGVVTKPDSQNLSVEARLVDIGGPDSSRTVNSFMFQVASCGETDREFFRKGHRFEIAAVGGSSFSDQPVRSRVMRAERPQDEPSQLCVGCVIEDDECERFTRIFRSPRSTLQGVSRRA
jgi:hypothetical protein